MLPELFCDRMRELLKSDAEAFFASYDKPRHVGLRFNPLKQGRPGFPLRMFFGIDPVPWAKSGCYYDPSVRPGLHPYHDAGLYYLQEPSAMAPAALLGAKPGERVLDLCAAPGGKSTQIACRMWGRGLIVCNEIHPKRAQILSGNIERLGIVNALVLNETPARLAERFPGWFDKVLVDAPCSGEGMFRKELAAVEDWSPDTVKMCTERQRGILLDAAKMLRPGGRMVYSTCTFAPEENEGTIAEFLRARPDFHVEHVEAPWFAPGHPEWADGNPELCDTFRLWPHLLEGEGHFAAVLRRDGEEAESDIPVLRGEALPKECVEFMRDNGIALPEGEGVLFGQNVYLAPKGTPDLRGLRVLRAGLELGQSRKGRFEPAHALALYLSEAKNMVSYDSESDEIRRYLRGETLPTDGSGWTLVQVDGLSLGWGKASAGILKNHYPKGLRRQA